MRTSPQCVLFSLHQPEKPLLTTEQEEHRAIHARYHFAKDVTNQNQSTKPASLGEEPRGKKRARAEDFL